MNSRLPPWFAACARPWLIAGLVCMLLGAQWTGLHHRIAHARLAQIITAPTADISSPDPTHPQDIQHSCALFDGLCIADTTLSVPPLLPRIPGTAVLALWSAYASWVAPPHRVFSSRAPPSI